MGINWNRFDYKVNTDFFKKWTSKMAYVLGFTFADGNIYKTTLSWDLRKDKELLIKINRVMKSNYPIHIRRASFRLRISNPIIIDDLQGLGLFPNKSRTMKLPRVPLKYFSHFARGFFDGDGWIYIRKSKNEISAGFSSGSQAFLKGFVNKLSSELKLTTNNLRIRRKITKRGIRSSTYQIDYSWENAYKVLLYIYSGMTGDGLLMKRKYKLYQEAKNLYEWVKSGGRKWRKLEGKFKRPMKEILLGFWEKGYNGPQMGEMLGVHSSSIYRWLIKTEVRPAFTEIRRKKVRND